MHQNTPVKIDSGKKSNENKTDGQNRPTPTDWDWMVLSIYALVKPALNFSTWLINNMNFDDLVTQNII